MKTYKQNGFVNLTTLIFLGIVAAGISYMYYKGYRVDVTTTTGAGAADGRNPDGLYYTVQVSVTPNEANAIGLVNDLENDGYDAYYDTYESERGRHYKVRVGQYGDKQSAAAVRAQVRQRYQNLKDSFVKLITEE